MDKKEKLKRQMGAPTHCKTPTQENVGATDRKERNFWGRERHIEVEAGVDADFCNPNQIQIVFGLAKFRPVKAIYCINSIHT